MSEKKVTKKVQIIGNALLLTSKLKLDTIKKIEKFNKDLLCLTEVNGDEVKELFRISIGKTADISKYGVVFTNADTNGNACATILLPNNLKNRTEYVKEEYGTALFMLSDLEDAIATAESEINAAFEKLNDDITEI